MKYTYLSKNYNELSSAGNKAKSDIETIMQREGFRNVGLSQTNFQNKVTGFLVTMIGVVKAPFAMKKGELLVLQYPFKKYFSLVCRLAHLRGCKVVAVIHDLGSFRRQKLTVEEEIVRLSNADYIVVHNMSMKYWLEQNGCKVPMTSLGIFDYLSLTVPRQKDTTSLPYSVLYAGALNIRKNRFLYELGNYIRSYTFNLYGAGFEAEKAAGREFLSYKGFVPSDQLIATAEGHFGLVWDGESVDTCSGDFGEYLQYNNPHKTSLYIRCELPVIIWKKAALAEFIIQNEIGITIDSLAELDEKLATLSVEEYVRMKQNVVRIAKRISEGAYIKEALYSAVK